jgi:hypothetical protein
MIGSFAYSIRASSAGLAGYRPSTLRTKARSMSVSVTMPIRRP